jgi:predicted ATPase
VRFAWPRNSLNSCAGHSPGAVGRPHGSADTGRKASFQTAAVIGNKVLLPLLQTIADMPQERLQRGLAHLQAAEFLYETSLYPERIYSFKHALTQNVAYQSLLVSKRKTVHQRIGRVLEKPFGDVAEKQPELLAHHYTEGFGTADLKEAKTILDELSD